MHIWFQQELGPDLGWVDRKPDARSSSVVRATSPRGAHSTLASRLVRSTPQKARILQAVLGRKDQMLDLGWLRAGGPGAPRPLSKPRGVYLPEQGAWRRRRSRLRRPFIVTSSAWARGERIPARAFLPRRNGKRTSVPWYKQIARLPVHSGLGPSGGADIV